MSEFIKDMIRHAVLTDEGTKWPTFDGGTLTRGDFVTASEAANCIRRLAFEKQAERDVVAIPNYWNSLTDEEYQARLDAMTDEDKRGIFARGHHMELWVKDKMEQATLDNEVLLCMGQDQLSFYLANERVSGTPDGMLLDTEAKTIRFIEIKSTINPMTAPRHNHINQTQTNMGIVTALIQRRELGSVRGWNLNDYVVTGASILYINPSNYLTMQEFWIDYDYGESLSLAALKAKLLFQEDGSIEVPEGLAPEGLEQWGGCTFCEFKSACFLIEELKNNAATAGKLQALMDGQAPARAANLPFFSADVRKDDVLRVIADYDAFNKAEKDAKDHKEALKKVIVGWIKTQKDMKVSFEDNGRLFKVSFSSSDRAGSLDSDKLAEFLSAHDKTLENFRKGPSKVDTLLVKVSAAD